MSKETFVYGSYIYRYELVKENRKTLSLTVLPDLRIYVKSPQKADGDRIEAFLRRKWSWLHKQLTYFKKFERKIYTKEYVSGEACMYLGRQYQLIVKKSLENNVSLSKGKMCVTTIKNVTESTYTKKLLDSWYAGKTSKIFNERFAEMLRKFDYPHIPKLVIRDMPKRWGSFISREKIVLNPRLVYTSKDCIDYVIVHELCHLKYKNHDKKFFELLRRKCSKWQKMKEKLEMSIVGIE